MSGYLRKRISFKDLNELHRVYWWIPNENMTRHSLQVMEDKANFSEYVLANWMSFRDFILNTYFNYKTDVEDAHHYVVDNVEKSEWIFVKSIFPFNLSEDVHHYVLWNSLYDCSVEIDEDIINRIITDSLRSQLNSDEFDFVWYVNQTPSIPELWHCQIFWYAF